MTEVKEVGTGQTSTTVAETDSSTAALTTLLGGSLQHLRAIKDHEVKWLERYTAVIFGLAALHEIIDPERFNGTVIVVLALIAVLFTAHVRKALSDERRSYYRVMRMVVRIENHLGLFKMNFIPAGFVNSAFPKGFGPRKDVDGTQPFHSYFRRNVYLFVVLALFLGALTLHSSGNAYLLLGAVVDVVIATVLFIVNRHQIARETRDDMKLQGMESSWS